MKSAFKLQGVSYSYPDSQKRAVENLTLKIEAGKTSALLGPNGGG